MTKASPSFDVSLPNVSTGNTFGTSEGHSRSKYHAGSDGVLGPFLPCSASSPAYDCPLTLSRASSRSMKFRLCKPTHADCQACSGFGAQDTPLRCLTDQLTDCQD